MFDSDFAPSRSDCDRVEFETSDDAVVSEPYDFEFPLRRDSAAEAIDIAACDVADCVPVKVAILDSQLRLRALNAEWRRRGQRNYGAWGEGFVSTCLSSASARDRSDVAERLAKLGPEKSEGFETTIELEADGAKRSFTLRARRLSQAPAFVVVALLDMTVVERATIARIVLDAEEAERRRIARELHDETSQRLAAVQLGLASLRQCGAGSKFDAACCDIEAMLRSVQNELRTLSYTLHPPEIDDAGLIEALSCFVKGFARRTRLKAVFVDGTRGLKTDGVADRALYRVTQEALTNVGKHAEATNAVVSLREHGQRLVLEVEDDGIGIAPELCFNRANAKLGVGLSAMRERIEALAGKFEVSRLKTGTLVRATLPIRGCGSSAVFRAL